MNIDLLSDLHLECYKDPVLALKHMVLWKEDPECLVIAGDFFTCVKETAFRSLVKFLTNEIGYKKIYYVSGNHEYYGSSIQKVDKFLTSCNSDSFCYLNSLSSPVLLVGKYKIFGRTLWSDLRKNSPIFKIVIQNRIADFSQIGYQNRTLRPDDVYMMYSAQYADLLQHTDSDTILVTHFSPTKIGCNPIFSGSDLNDYFDLELTELLENKKPYKILHGHTHFKRHVKVCETDIHSQPGEYPKNNMAPTVDIFRFTID